MHLINLFSLCSSLSLLCSHSSPILPIPILSLLPPLFIPNHRKLRQSEASQLLLLLCFAFLGIYLAYIFAYFATPVPGLCAVAGALVHYTLLVTFVTMAAEAIYIFLKIVIVFTSVDRYVAKAGIVAWREFICYYFKCVEKL